MARVVVWGECRRVVSVTPGMVMSGAGVDAHRGVLRVMCIYVSLVKNSICFQVMS